MSVTNIKNQRKFKGIVTSNKMDKTIVVKVVRTRMQPKYKKQYQVSKKYKVHDEKNEAKIGSEVMFKECKPLSKDKRWCLIQIIK